MGIVKSVEFIELNTTDTLLSQGLTKGQDYSNCVPFLSCHGGQDYLDAKRWDAYFTGTTESGTINFYRANGRSTEGYVKCFVVEFDPAEVYVESGTFDVSASNTDTVTTSGVFNPERTGMIHHYWADYTGQQVAPMNCRGSVTASGSLDFYRSDTSSSLQGHWYVFEAKDDQYTVEHMFDDSSGDYRYLKLSKSYDPLNTFVLASTAGGYASNGYLDRTFIRLSLTNRDTLLRHKASSSQTAFFAGQIIEFQDDRIHIPFGYFVELDETTEDLTWYEDGRSRILADLDYSMVINAIQDDYCNTTQAAGLDGSSSSVKFTSASGIQLAKNTQYVTTTASIYVVDWEGYTISGTTNPSPLDPTDNFVKSVENFRIPIKDYQGHGYVSKGQDFDNCVIFSSGYSNTNVNTAAGAMHDVYPSVDGVIGVRRGYDDSEAWVDVSVVEFYPDQVRVQSGIFRSDATPEFSIPLEHSVDVDKTFFVASWSSDINTNNWTWQNHRWRLIDSNNIGVYSIHTSRHHATWYLAEDITNDNSCFDVFHWNSDSSGDILTSTTNMMFPKDRSFSFLSYAGGYDTGDYPERNCIRGYYYSPAMPLRTDVSNASNTKYQAGQSVRIRRSGRYYTYHWNPAWAASTPSVEISLATTWSGFENITAYNTNRLGAALSGLTSQDECDRNLSAIRITDYYAEGGPIAQAQMEYGSLSVIYPSYTFINWEGVAVEQPERLTPTRSLIRSVANYNYTGDLGSITFYLSTHQEAVNCVPFITNKSHANPCRAQEIQMLAVMNYEMGEPYSVSIERGDSTRNESDSINLYIIEFDPDQVKVQSGIYSVTSADFTVTIDEVDLDKAFLHFFPMVDGDRTWPQANITGLIEDSTTLRFKRDSDYGVVCIYWYVIECLQDQWTTQHLESSSSSSSDLYNAINPRPDAAYLMCNSYRGGYDTGDYPDRNMFRTVADGDGRARIERNNATSNMVFTSEVLSFNRNISIKVLYNALTLNVIEDTAVLNVPPLVENRTFIFNPCVGNTGRNGLTSQDAGSADSVFLMSLEDLDTDPTVRMKKGRHQTISYSCACVVEVPEYKKYYMEGYTKEQSKPAPREVRAYRADTGSLMDTTISVSGTGYFWLETTYSGAHYVVCLDDEAAPDYNDLIYSRIYPTVISGTFHYNTASGTGGSIPSGGYKC